MQMTHWKTLFIDRPAENFHKIAPSENAGVELIVLSIVGVGLILLKRLNLKCGDSN